MPVASDIHLVDGRYQRYVGHGEYVHPGYKSEAHRRRSVLVGNLLLAAIPLGSAAGAAHIAIKGSRFNRLAGRYQATKPVKFYSPEANRFFTIRPFVTRANRKAKLGLPGKVARVGKGIEGAKHTAGKWARDLPVIGKGLRIRDTVQFLDDPVRVVGRRLPLFGTAVFLHETGKRVKSAYDDYVYGGYGDMAIDPPSSERIPIIFNKWDGQGEPVPPRRRPSSPHQRLRKSKSQGRCPSGHRWSSKLKKCVRYRRRR